MKNFRVNIILRISLLVITIFVFCYYTLGQIFFPWLALIACAIIYQTYALIKYIDRTNKELTYLLQSINFSDFSQSFNFAKLGSSFKELSNEFNTILNKFKQTRSEKEESLNYLQTVVQHIGVGLISFDTNGDVEFINKAAKRLLKINSLRNICVLDQVSPNLSNFIFHLQPGKKAAYKISDNEEIIQLVLYATDFRMHNKMYKLVALQNIQSELEEKEIEAWQKLIRVLTHEIMNSVTPISSLASIVNQYLKNFERVSINQETIEDVRSAISTIQKRSEGLVNFVEKYRSLTKIPKPDYKIFRVSQLFERIKILMESVLQGSQIKFTAEVNPDYLELTADSDLLEQVLINLLNNSIQSIADSNNGKISLTAQIDQRGRSVLKVIDNGPGISSEIIDKIFIPFFSTRKDGSGIGLSLSQQIIQAQNGSISVSSRPNEETVFSIRF